MRTLITSVAFVLACAVAISAQQLSDLPLPPGGNGRSPRAEVSEWIGPVKITIAYYRPHVRTPTVDRKGHIWGETIPYGLFDDDRGLSRATPWRAGANESTTISFSHDVQIEHHAIKAGTYALFLELHRDGRWTWIFSRHAIGWGSYQYNPADDVLRVDIQPAATPHTELLTYEFADHQSNDSAIAVLRWEERRIPFEIEVPNVDTIYVDEMRTALDGWPGFNYQNWQTAAQFCADHKINLDEALVWADRAISEPFRGAAFGREDFSTLQTKAAVLDAMNRSAEADVIMDRALTLPGTQVFLLYQYGNRLLTAGRSAKALVVFTQNQRSHPDEYYWTSLGLARGYTAAGDKANAIEHWEIVLRNVPDGQRSNVAQFTKTLDALKHGG